MPMPAIKAESASCSTVEDAPPNKAVPSSASPSIEISSRTSPPPKPKHLPFEAIPENVPKLKQFIIDSFSSSAFNNTTDPFPALSTPPAKIHVKTRCSTLC